MIGHVFVGVMLALQFGAVIAYAYQHRWPDALYWLGATIINGAVLWKAL